MSQNTLVEAARLLERKPISLPRLKYLLRSVIFPAVAYPLALCHPPPPAMLKLNLTVRRMARKSLKLHKRFPRAFIHSDLGLGLPSLAEHLVTSNLSNLLCPVQPTCSYQHITKAYL